MLNSKSVLLTRIIYDKDDNIIKKETDYAHSWTRNAYNLSVMLIGAKTLPHSSFGNGYLSLKTTSGSIIYSSYYGYSLYDCAPANTGAYGIQIGTSNEGFSFEDYTLKNRILSGCDSGRMVYLAEIAGRYFSGEDLTITRSRRFLNNSQASITVREIGLTYRITAYSPDVYWYVLVLRDVLSGNGDTIPYAGYYDVVYEFFINFPE